MAATARRRSSSSATGPSGCTSRGGRCAIPRRCYRNGRRARACRPRFIARSNAPGRITIRGFVIENNAQIILVDTPGIFLPKRRLDRAMVSTAWIGAHDADLVCVLLDAREGIDEEAEAILTKLATVRHEKILVLNKIDLVPREKLLKLAQAVNERLKFAETFMVSAMTGDGVDDLRHTLAAMVPPG